MGYSETTCPQGYMGSTFYILIVMLLLHCEQVQNVIVFMFRSIPSGLLI